MRSQRAEAGTGVPGSALFNQSLSYHFFLPKSTQISSPVFITQQILHQQLLDLTCSFLKGSDVEQINYKASKAPYEAGTALD